MALPTTITDIADLSRILQENPEWREHFRALLLTSELLELPAAMAALTAEVRAFIVEQREINDRADARMDALTAELRAFIVEQREINDRADARMDALTAELREFIVEQRQWNAEQKKINEAIFARLDRVDVDIEEMKGDIKQMKGDISQLKGRQAERDTHRNIVNLLLERHPGLRRIVILKSDLIQFETELNDRIEDAEDEGLITADERKALRAVDLIVRAIQRDTRQTLYFAIEVSRAIANYDVDRAANRAAILSRVTQAPGAAAVIGGSVNAQASQRAEEREVSVILSRRLTD